MKLAWAAESIEHGEMWDLSDMGTNRTAAYFCQHVVVVLLYFCFETKISFFTRCYVLIRIEQEV